MDATTNRIPLVTTDELARDYAHMEARVVELECKLHTLPATIDDDETSGTWQEVISDINGHSKTVEATRVDVKDPYYKAGSTVDGFFKGLISRNTATVNAISQRVGDYLRRKRDAERQRLLAEAKEREEKARREREEAAERERLAKVAEEAGRLKAAEAHRAKAEAASIQAQEAQGEAVRAETLAYGRSADLARTRSAGGALGTLRDTWDFRIADIEKVKGALLWSFVTRAAKEAAIRAYIRANAPRDLPDGQAWTPIAGVEFYRTSDLQVRR